jgi:RHS repeat-associated protein
VTGATTKFLYDGIDPIRELNASNTPTANLVTGLGVDEIFSRTHALGTETILTDALGSTLALSDSTGVVNTSYTYEPYGKTTKSGAATTNSFGYTGREDDGTGLYYYRARYYHPGLSRFISEDPLGIAAGPNGYAYVKGNPISYLDPLGLWTGQIGVNLSVNLGGPLTFSMTGGVAFDGHGNVAGYVEYGGGASTSPDVSGGLALHGSNGDSIQDLNGLFVNVTAGGGWGAHASGDGFFGYGSHGQRVEGGGITIGVGAGGSSSVTVTNTAIGNPLHCH